MSPDDPRESLTAAGEARHRQILAAAFREADRRQRKGLARRGAVLAGVGALIGLSVLLVRAPSGPSRPQIATGLETHASGPVTHASIATQKSPPAVEHAKPSGLVVEFISADQIQRRWESIDDDQLLDALADAGQRAGLIRINGRSEIVPQ